MRQIRTRCSNMPVARRWEHFPHEADVGVRGIGATKSEAFAEAAAAMTAVSVDPARVRPDERIAISCAAPDDELLLVDWLNALLYEMAARRMVFGQFEVELRGGTLIAAAWGERVDVARHEPAVEVKGATYTALKVVPSDGGWIAQCVVDV